MNIREALAGAFNSVSTSSECHSQWQLEETRNRDSNIASSLMCSVFSELGWVLWAIQVACWAICPEFTELQQCFTVLLCAIHCVIPSPGHLVPSGHDQRLSENCGTALHWWFCLEVDWVGLSRKYYSIGFFQWWKHGCKASRNRAINGGRNNIISVVLRDIF